MYAFIFSYMFYIPSFPIAGLVFAILFNFGLFFITTKSAKKFRVTATILYAPTVLITPFMVGPAFMLMGPDFLGVVGIVVLFLLSLLVFYYFYPWRQPISPSQ